MNRRKLLRFAPLAIVGIAALVFIGGEVVLQLWNWLAPALFGWHQITFWQAIGILALCRILFGGHGSYRPGFRRRMSDQMAEGMAERWHRMSPEERDRFRQGIRARFGVDPCATENKGQA